MYVREQNKEEKKLAKKNKTIQKQNTAPYTYYS
jgi:hypothetical protein